MFTTATIKYVAEVTAETLRTANLDVDVGKCVEACPRLAAQFKQAKRDPAEMARMALLAHLEMGDSLFDVTADKPKLEYNPFKSEAFCNEIIAVGVAAILEEYPEAFTAAERYTFYTECLLRKAASRRKAGFLDSAKINVANFRTMFPNPTIDNVQEFLDAGAFVKPKVPKKRAKKPVEEPAEEPTESEKPSESEEKPEEPSESEKPSESENEEKKEKKKGRAKKAA
jgi:hypothetical protein